MSIWTLNEKKRPINKLNADLDVDTLIIGGGITGLTCAYFLKDLENVCLVDADIIGHGVTMNSTAKINYFQQCIYTNIADNDYDKAVIYLKSQKEAISLIKNIIEKENISCDFENVPSYVFASSKDEVVFLENEVKFLRDNHCEVIKKEPPINCNCYEGYCVDDTYIFNPIKYLNGLYNILKNKISIYENSRIFEVEKTNDKYICIGDGFKITCKRLVLGCHYPFFLLPLLIPMRSSIEKSYMVVSRVNNDRKFTCINTNNPVYSCRFYNDGKNIYQISLSRSRNLAFSKDDEYQFSRVCEIFNIKDEDIILKYSNTDIMTFDHMPYIGEIDNNMYIGLGYNTWGMTNGVLAGKIISDLILKGKNEYAEIFNPKRINFSSMLKFPLYVFNNMKSYVGSKINKNKNWYSNNVRFKNIDGDNVGVYIDEEGNEHIVYNKCPHLGCSLVFNEVEKTWDCPCHSSRFDIDGKRIKGPSVLDITYNKKR